MFLSDKQELTAKNYLESFRDKPGIEVTIETFTNHVFHTTLDEAAQQIVKVYSKKWNEIVSTGMFITDKHVVTCYNLGKESLSNFEIVTHNHRRLAIATNSSEIFLKTSSILILEVENMDDEMIDPIKITQKKFEQDSFPANAIYYQPPFHRIFGQEKIMIKNFNEQEYFTDVKIGSGAEGAPLFKRQEGPIDKWDFIGMIRNIQSSGTSIIKSTEIHKSLVEGYDSQTDAGKQTIKYIIGDIVEKETINAIDEVEIVEGQTLDYTKIAVYLLPRKLIELGPRTTSRREYNIGNDFGPGYSVIGCSLGAMITGGRNRKKSAYVWQKQVMNIMPMMQNDRENHTSICFNGNVVVIGGSTNTCELFDVQTTQWYGFAETNVMRANATAVTYSGSIYLFGGYNTFNNRYFTSIEQYINGQWTLSGLDFKLPMPLANAGGIRLDDDKIMIFGGQCAPAEINDNQHNSSLIIDLPSKTSEIECKLPFSGQFSSFSPIQTDQEFFIYSSDGSAISYNFRRKKFYDLRVS